MDFLKTIRAARKEDTEWKQAFDAVYFCQLFHNEKLKVKG